jgi:hypothetical protein
MTRPFAVVGSFVLMSSNGFRQAMIDGIGVG